MSAVMAALSISKPNRLARARPSFSPNHKEGPAFARRADGPMKIVDPFKTGYRRPGRSLPFPKSPHR